MAPDPWGKRRKGTGDVPGRRRSHAAADLAELRPLPADSLATSEPTVVCRANASRASSQAYCRFSLFPCNLHAVDNWPIEAATVPLGQLN